MSIVLFGLAALHANARRDKAERNAKALTTVGMAVKVMLDKDAAGNHPVVASTLLSLPWKLGDGSWVAGVAGQSGGYCCSRITPA